MEKNSNEGVNISICETSTNPEQSLDSEADRYDALRVKCLKLLAKGSKNLNAYHLTSEAFDEPDEKIIAQTEVQIDAPIQNEDNEPARHDEYYDLPVSQYKRKRNPQGFKPPADITKDKKRRICSGCGKKEVIIIGHVPR